MKMKSLWALCAFLLASCAAFQSSSEFFDLVEPYLLNLASEFSYIIDDSSAYCRNSSFGCISASAFDACGSFHDESLAACDVRFGNSSSCLCRGQLVDTTLAAVRVPLADEPDSTRSLRELACITSPFDSEWQAALRNDNMSSVRWQYFADADGGFRFFPSTAWWHATQTPKCDFYDPRDAPWYQAAISGGSRNMIFLIDMSASMAPYFDFARELVRRMVLSLPFTDHVGVISISGIRVKSSGESLLPATLHNKCSILEMLDSCSAWGGTGFLQAFEEAFKLLDRSRLLKHISSCENSTFITWITDGIGTNPLQELRSANTKERARVSVVSVGVLQKLKIPRAVACETDGLWLHVGEPSSTDVSLTMKNLRSFFSLRTPISPLSTYCSEPYEDLLGSGPIITCSSPVIGHQSQRFHGVVATDFSLCDIWDYWRDRVTFHVENILRQDFCPTSDISKCDLINLRTQISLASVCDADEPSDCGILLDPVEHSLVCANDSLWRVNPPLRSEARVAMSNCTVGCSSVCPNQCNAATGQGICNWAFGVCQCEDDWHGEDCSCSKDVSLDQCSRVELTLRIPLDSCSVAFSAASRTNTFLWILFLAVFVIL